MPDLIADALDCVGERSRTGSTCGRSGPLYRATYADGSSARRARRRRRDGRGDRGRVRPGARRRATARYVDFVSKLYRLEMRDFIDRNIDSPLDLLTPDLARLAALGGFRRLAPKVAQYLKDDRTAAGLLVPVDVRRALAVRRARDLRRHRLHGLRRRRVLPARRHARAARGRWPARRRSTAWSSGTARRSTPSSGAASRAVAVHTGGGERVPCDASCSTPTCPSPTGTCSVRAADGRRLRYSPSCFLLLAGSHARLPRRRAPQHLVRAVVARRLRRADGRAADERPVAARHRADGRSDPALAPPGRSSYYVLFPTPNLDAGIDWRSEGPRYRDEVVADAGGARVRRASATPSRSST